MLWRITGVSREGGVGEERVGEGGMGMGRFWVCGWKVVSVFLAWRLLWQCTVTAHNDHTHLLLEERSTIVDLPMLGDHAWRTEGLAVRHT